MKLIAIPHSQVPPHDQPFEVALPSLMEAIPVVIEFDRQALCTVCKGRGGLAQVGRGIFTHLSVLVNCE